MFVTPLLATILVTLISGILSKSVELTFELPDSAVECFYQDIEKNTSAALEYQVITGGQYDVDVKVEGPNKQIIYQQQKMQYDSHQFVAQISGVYKVCFSNEFSTFSHKLVYMELNVGPEEKLPGLEGHDTVLTQLATSAEEIHSALNRIIDHQTHHRLREAQSRKRAEDLNERVFWWSLCESLAVVCVAFVQLATSAEEIHSALNRIIDHQTHHRLREAQSRKRAEDLNERVFWWSLCESLAVVCVAFVQLATSAEEIHSALNRIIDHQTHHRLREAQSRKRAEDLNERVFWWSLCESLAVVCVAFVQVMVLKNFFSDRPTLYNKM